MHLADCDAQRFRRYSAFAVVMLLAERLASTVAPPEPRMPCWAGFESRHLHRFRRAAGNLPRCSPRRSRSFPKSTFLEEIHLRAIASREVNCRFS